MSMSNKEKFQCMRIEYVQITNEEFFTEERLQEWRVFIAKCCTNICEGMMAKVAPECHITYFCSMSLLEEVIGDAVIGMAKIIDKTPHPIERPNAFKVAAYLAYWFLRHKPISVIYPRGIDLDDIRVAAGCDTDAGYLGWQLKHINEAVAVDMVTSFLFDFEKEVCTQKQCEKIKRENVIDGEPAFTFDTFEQQRKIMMQKLTYYFAYRAIAPKVIEHVLEGYAFHPAWGMTGAHWATSMEETLDEK